MNSFSIKCHKLE
ncbi:hypothetical protein VCHENC02_2974A, partial [Vibrio harveyi]